MTDRGRSPRITRLSWGSLEIEGGASFRDAKLFPGGGREWDWAETGTAHTPGILPDDVAELLEHGATVILLSRGVLGRLGVSGETLSFLEGREVRLHVAPTGEAVQLYNELRETQAVGGLFHTTC